MHAELGFVLNPESYRAHSDSNAARSVLPRGGGGGASSALRYCFSSWAFLENSGCGQGNQTKEAPTGADF